MTKITLETLSKDGTLIVDASSYVYGTPLVSDTQVALRGDSEKKVKKIVYTHTTPIVQNRMFDFFGREYTVTTEGEDLVMEVRNKMTTISYNPRNIDKHRGRVYRTKKEEFFFNENGKFYLRGTQQRNPAEGTTPEMIVGINPEYKEQIQLMFAGHQRAGLLELIEQNGEEPETGKLLVFVLSKKTAGEVDRIGFYSGLLEEIK